MGALTMEVEKVNNTLLTEKQRKRREKEQKQQYEQELFNHFYSYFKKYQDDIEKANRHFSTIENREKILNEICKSKYDVMYLNTLYDKKLKEVYKIFQNNIACQEQKENSDNLLACENELRNSINRIFERCITKDSNNLSIQIVMMQFYKIENREEFLKTYSKNSTEYDYLSKNYDKILNEVSEKWKKHVIALQSQKQIGQLQAQKEQMQQRKQQLEKEVKKKKRQQIFKLLGHTLLVILAIVFIPLTIILGCIFQAAKRYK